MGLKKSSILRRKAFPQNSPPALVFRLSIVHTYTMRTPFIHIAILIAFLVNTLGPLPLAQAQASPAIGGDFRLPAPGVMVHLSPPLEPPILKGIKVHTDDPFRFDFILDQGDSLPKSMSSPNALVGDPQQEQLKTEATKLIKYFLASLTIPEKDLWVNLSPYEKDRIIPQSFGLTEMGRDLLAEDYMLKQITASLIYPEDEIGKKFWKRVYEQAAKKYGTTNIPVNTFNKVWIVPEKAVVYENAKAGTAYVVESKLKVMLEQDYLALEKNQRHPGDMFDKEQQKNVSPSTLPSELGLNAKAPQGNHFIALQETNALGSQIVREVVIPELTKEVNENKNFSQLRQVYNSLILATWYKKKIKDSILAQVYADKNKVAGVGYKNSPPLVGGARGGGTNDVEVIYQRYLQAFKKGVYNYIKEDIDPLTQETIPRKYFSGGLDMAMNTNLRTTSLKIVNTIAPAMFPKRDERSFVVGSRFDQAMESETYVEYLKAKNPQLATYTGSPEIHDTTFPLRYPGLYDLLLRSSDTTGNSLKVALMGPGMTWSQGVFESPQLFEVMSVLSAGYSDRPIELSVISNRQEELSRVLRSATYGLNENRVRWQKYRMLSNRVQDSLKRFLKEGLSYDIAKYNTIIPDNVNIQPLLANFRDLDYGKNQLDLMIGTFSLVYDFTGKRQSIELFSKFIKALKPNGRLLVDAYTLNVLIPELGDFNSEVVDTFLSGAGVPNKVTEWLVAPKMRNFSKKVVDVLNNFEKTLFETYGMNIRIRLYQNVVEIERLPSGSSWKSIENIGQRLYHLTREGLVLYQPLKIGKIGDSAQLAVDRAMITPAQKNAKRKEILGRYMSRGISDGLLKKLEDRGYYDPKRTLTYKIMQDFLEFLKDKENSEKTDAELINKIGRIIEGYLSKNRRDKKSVEKEKENIISDLNGVFGEYMLKSARQLFLPFGDQAMKAKTPGGIDLTPARMNLQTQNAGGGIKFYLDPAMLEQLRNAPGFVPVIINIQPMTDLRQFLGVQENSPTSVEAV